MTQTIYGSLKGKTVLVTGGASGIGESVAEAFHAQGCRVGILDYNAEAGQALAQRLGEHAHFEHNDVRDIPALQHAIGRVSAALGPITILVNNAARDDRHTIDEVTPDYWRERFATNLDHQFFATQAVLADMDKAGGGSVINMGSTSYLVSEDSFAAYKTAKSAVVGLTRALARELGPRHIRVNSIVPGWIMTKRQIDLWLTPEGEAELLKRQCVKRHLMPEDVARVALFLASDDASAITAQSYLVDGGWV
ncbi:SDR family NAD(P)-dependent oxidoreductase [Microvirga brassicacearum]|uniref:SDR family oxidoreductase n=1 Tax=Microvirga brassicacearum TaxID=2580413 RepID=A0A5N3PF56_9HYPH|nr:SDR family NAD(P)-dependent oxidoreductase [Microvirga brassicacearum]KAB0268353.1 SDR family oxidoreductase [Microvirga brassicacearum]